MVLCARRQQIARAAADLSLRQARPCCRLILAAGPPLLQAHPCGELVSAAAGIRASEKTLSGARPYVHDRTQHIAAQRGATALAAPRAPAAPPALAAPQALIASRAPDAPPTPAEPPSERRPNARDDPCCIASPCRAEAALSPLRQASTHGDKSPQTNSTPQFKLLRTKISAPNPKLAPENGSNNPSHFVHLPRIVKLLTRDSEHAIPHPL